MRTIADWQRYNNNSDVVEKMKNGGTDESLMKESVFTFAFRGSVDRRAELQSPAKKFYEMLKELLLGYKALERGTVIKAAY